MKEGHWGSLKHRKRSNNCWKDGGGKWTAETWGKPGCKMALLQHHWRRDWWPRAGLKCGIQGHGQGRGRLGQEGGQGPQDLAALPLLSAQSALIFLHPTFWHPLTPYQNSLTVLSLQGARGVGGSDRKVKEEECEMHLPLPEEPVQLPWAYLVLGITWSLTTSANRGWVHPCSKHPVWGDSRQIFFIHHVWKSISEPLKTADIWMEDAWEKIFYRNQESPVSLENEHWLIKKLPIEISHISSSPSPHPPLLVLVENHISFSNHSSTFIIPDLVNCHLQKQCLTYLYLRLCRIMCLCWTQRGSQKKVADAANVLKWS